MPIRAKGPPSLNASTHWCAERERFRIGAVQVGDRAFGDMIVDHIKTTVGDSLGLKHRAFMAQLVPILEQLHDVTFAEFLASWRVPRDGPHDSKRTIEDVAHRGEQHRRSAGH